MRICAIGKFPPIQGGVSMRTYWTAHGLAAYGHEVHVVTNAKEVASTIPNAYAGGRLGAMRGAGRQRFRNGALDRSDRPFTVLPPDGEPVCLQARRHLGPPPSRTAV